VDTDDSTINDNKIQGSQNGVFLDSQSNRNKVQLNDAYNNTTDINNANGLGLIEWQFTIMFYFQVVSGDLVQKL
jgi:parallel beta-helix repeat protein